MIPSATALAFILSKSLPVQASQAAPFFYRHASFKPTLQKILLFQLGRVFFSTIKTSSTGSLRSLSFKFQYLFQQADVREREGLHFDDALPQHGAGVEMVVCASSTSINLMPLKTLLLSSHSPMS